jgi:hypothetical protein
MLSRSQGSQILWSVEAGGGVNNFTTHGMGGRAYPYTRIRGMGSHYRPQATDAFTPNG